MKAPTPPNKTVAASAQAASAFEALRQSLELPESALVGDALHFLIGENMNVVALMSETQRLLLLVELAPMEQLSAKDWQRLIMHLSSHFDDDTMGRLMVLDRKLSMAWSSPADIDPLIWVPMARAAMLWCTGTRELIMTQTSTHVQQ